jgi:hypothetical protein
MIIGTRVLKLRGDKIDTDIPIHIHAPERAKIDWICRFEIEWPRNKVSRWGAGVDALQSLHQAMQMIGAEIYASEYHATGRLSWLMLGAGYGFPVPNTIRDLLVGEDARHL